jgi:hypothetical protein
MLLGRGVRWTPALVFAMSETGLTESVPSSPSVTDRKEAAKTRGVVVLRPTAELPFIHACKVPLGVDVLDVLLEVGPVVVLLAAVAPFVLPGGEVLSGVDVVPEPELELVAFPRLSDAEVVPEAVGQVGRFAPKAAAISVLLLLVIEMFVVLRATSTT